MSLHSPKTCSLLKEGHAPFRRKAMLLSPLAAAPAIVLFFLASKPGDLIDGLYAGLFATIIALPVSYLSLLLFGLPYICFLQRSGMMNTLYTVLGSIPLAMVIGYLIGWQLEGEPGFIMHAFMIPAAFVAPFVAYAYCHMNGIAWRTVTAQAACKEDE